MASIEIDSSPSLLTAADHKDGGTVCHQARLSFSPGETSKSVAYKISNHSKFFEYCPVLQAKINDPGDQFKFTVKVGNRDFTREAVKDGGLVFVNDLRLMPKEEQNLTLTIERNPGPSVVTSLEMPSVKFTLYAHPSEMKRIIQTAELDVDTTSSTEQITSNR